MSLAINILKVCKAFNNPAVPHNPKYFMLEYDLIDETKLEVIELFETLDALQKAGVVDMEQSGDFPASISVTKPYRELMGVADK